MFVIVKAMNPGHLASWRAGRRFDNGVAVRLEVVDGDVKLDKNGNGPLDAAGLPSMEQITRKGYEALLKDDSLLVGGDDEASSRISQAAIDSARDQARKAASDLADAKMRIAELEAGNTSLKDRCADLEAALAKATGGDAEKDAGGESKAEDKGATAKDHGKKK